MMCFKLYFDYWPLYQQPFLLRVLHWRWDGTRIPQWGACCATSILDVALAGLCGNSSFHTPCPRYLLKKFKNRLKFIPLMVNVYYFVRMKYVISHEYMSPVLMLLTSKKTGFSTQFSHGLSVLEVFWKMWNCPGSMTVTPHRRNTFRNVQKPE